MRDGLRLAHQADPLVDASGVGLLPLHADKGCPFQGIGGGDGFDVMPDAEDANWVYSMSQGGAVGRYNIATGEEWSIRPPSPAPGVLGSNFSKILNILSWY